MLAHPRGLIAQHVEEGALVIGHSHLRLAKQFGRDIRPPAEETAVA
jgi:hypothetical protein